MKVYLDDERSTPEGWTRVYWPDEAIRLLRSDEVTEISLDHDLEESQRLEFLQKLTISAGSARSTLRPVVAVNSQSRSHHGNSSSVSPRRRR